MAVDVLSLFIGHFTFPLILSCSTKEESSRILGSQLKKCRPLPFRYVRKGCIANQLIPDTPFMHRSNATWDGA